MPLHTHPTVTLDSFHVVGYSIRTTPQQAMQDIGALWQQCQAEQLLAHIPHKASHDILAVYYAYESDHLAPYSYMIGSKVTQIDRYPPGATSLTIPSSHFTVFTAKGAFPQSLVATWKDIWEAGIDRTFTYDFEVYNEAFQQSSDPDKKVEVFINTHLT